MRTPLRMHRSAPDGRAAAPSCGAKPWHAILLLALALALGACVASPAPSAVAESPAAPAAPVTAKTAITPYVPNTYCSMQPRDPVYARCNVKLGLPKEEATAVLTESQRKFLDGVLRIYSEPGLLPRRKEVLAALGAEVESTRVSHTTWPDGRRTIDWRSDSFKSVGLFTAYKYWSSSYKYRMPRYPPWTEGRYRWSAEIYIAINQERECLASLAVEGYLDIPLSSRIFGYVHGQKPPEKWDRHGPGGHMAIAERLSKLSPRLEIDIIDGCLSRVGLEGHFFSSEVGDDDVLN